MSQSTGMKLRVRKPLPLAIDYENFNLPLKLLPTLSSHRVTHRTNSSRRRHVVSEPNAAADVSLHNLGEERNAVGRNIQLHCRRIRPFHNNILLATVCVRRR